MALLPFLLGALAGIVFFIEYGRYKFISLAACAFLFALLLLLSRTGIGKMREPAIIITLFVVAILIRASSQVFFHTQPISDYLDAIKAAVTFTQGPQRSPETARFPYWGFYRITLSYLFRIFNCPVITAKIANLLFSGLTAVAIYLLGKRIFTSRKFGLIASLVFIIDPANILYINLPTGEHIFTMLFPVAVLLFLALSDDPDRKIALRIMFTVLLGFLVGLMDMYKPLALILLIAFFISLVLTEFLKRRIEGKKEERRKRFILHGLLILIILVSYFFTKEVCFSAIAHFSEIPPNRYGIGWTLRVGLDMENEGRISAPLAYDMHTLYRESGEDYRAVNDTLLKEAFEQVKGKDLATLFHFVKGKFEFTWQSNQDFYNWATNTQMENSLIAFDPAGLAVFVDPLNDAFLIFSLVFSALGAIYCAYKRSDKGTLAIGLFLLGFTLLLLATEVQQRYRSILASSIPIFAAYGVHVVGQGVAFLAGFLNDITNTKQVR